MTLLPSTEAARLNALNQYKILDTSSEKVFDDLTRLAAYVCGSPTALISLIDTDRQWIKSKVSFEPSQTSRDTAFCAHAILELGLFIVRDTYQDIRFVDNPLVTSEPKIRFYAGAPLINPDGLALGTLCVIDYVPRDLTPEQQEALQILALQVITQMELRRNLVALQGVNLQCQMSESSLQTNKRWLSSLINSLPGIAFYRKNDPECSMKYLSKGCHNLTEYKREELLGNAVSYNSITHPEDLPKVLKVTKAAITGSQPYVVEYRISTKSGQEKWLWEKGSGVFDKLGEVFGLEGFITDITARKQVKATLQKAHDELEIRVEERTVELRKANEKLQSEIVERQRVEDALYKSVATNRALINALPDLIFRISKDGTFVNFKASKENNLLMPPSEFLGKKLYDVLPQEVAVPTMHCVEQALETGKIQIFEYQLLIDTNLYDYEARIVVSAEDEVMAIVRDITERKQVETEIRNALVKEKELSELKSRFVTMTSHEFQTPLTTILSSAELLEDYSSKWSEAKRNQHLQRIQIAVQHMTQLLNDVLLLGKVEAGKLECNPTSLDVAQFCRELVDEILLVTTDHIIIFQCQGKCIDAYLDEKLLRQILSNLLSNAIKYSPQCGTIRFDLICEQREVLFQIQDWGIGIPDTDQTQLFDSFYRASNVSNISGTGLGLAIVKKAVDLHSGKITVESKVGVGTKFIVFLPLK